MNYVTGASGFIGSHLFRRVPAPSAGIPHDYLPGFMPHEFESFFFLSTYGNIWGQTDWRLTFEANVIQPINLLLGQGNMDGKFIYVSTSSVSLPVQTAYSYSKRAAECLLLSLIDQGRKIWIARPYSVTGVGEQRSHLIPTLIRSCLEGEPMKLCLLATHDFVDVEDFVSGLLKITEQPPGIYEFGTGRALSNLAVLELVEQLTGKKANIVGEIPARPYDNLDWFCTKPMPGWKHTKHVNNSIAEMIRAYDGTPKAVC